MCLGSPPSPPDPPPLAPPPPPPPPPERPLPPPEDLEIDDPNPAIQPARDKKDDTPGSSGTESLLIEPEVQTGTGNTGGTNVP